MAAGYDLKEGAYVNRPLSEDEMWSAFAYLFSTKSVNDTSYKFGFLKSILDNLYNTDKNLILTFDQLFSKFAEVYWNLVLEHHILQKKPGKLNRTTALERTLYEAKEKYAIADGVRFESLSDSVMLDICKNVKKKCKENVVGALYGDLGGMFYSFSKKGEWIQFNPQMYEFVCKHKTAIEKLNYYEWAKFMERVNETTTVDHLLNKLDESTKRKSLAYYRDILFQEFENKCFYCGKPVTKEKVHVDHFIPWSFIKDDKLWNFVLACPTCNSQKRDKLASELFRDRLTRRNETVLLVHRKQDMKHYQEKRLVEVYSWAQMNGYRDTWSPMNQYN